jgi:ribosomal protein S18 acetylase RimI-like enzyme
MNAGDVRIRTALPADRDALVALIRILNTFEAALTQDRLVTRAAADAYHRSLLERIARQEGRLLVADVDGRVVGFMSLIVQEDQPFVREEVRRHGYVLDLVVDEEWRGQGIGRALLSEAERLTREKGLKRLVIGVVSGNDAAERLYEDCGFKIYAKAMLKAV